MDSKEFRELINKERPRYSNIHRSLIDKGYMVSYVNSVAGAQSLSGLTDVTISGLTDQDILSYNSATTQWENVEGMIIDVTNPVSGDTLVYDSGIWVNSGVSVDMSNYYTSGQCNANCCRLLRVYLLATKNRFHCQFRKLFDIRPLLRKVLFRLQNLS